MSFRICCVFFLIAVQCSLLLAREYHVSPQGDNQNPGTLERPLKTIQAAADLAQPGSVITVHEGVYRESVDPPRGGESEEERIVYQAAEGVRPEIKGSELLKDWEHLEGDVWKTTVPNTFFKGSNPFELTLDGHWFKGYNIETHHRADVFLNGKSLYEIDSLDKVKTPEPLERTTDPEGSLLVWYAEVNEQVTIVWANFGGANPNEEQIECSIRPACFYPTKTGRNYITVRGFRMNNTATPWSAATTEQVGTIGTHWSKGWIIEDCKIHDSQCAGLTLGKNAGLESDGMEFLKVTRRARKEYDWNRDKIGSHLVQNNEIYNCEGAAICGSLGAIFSIVRNNHIHHIQTKRQFRDWETSGIKFHAPIHVLIEGNRIHDTTRCMWMDWMAQGQRITRNLCYNNDTFDLFFEVCHGPAVVDNNLFLSEDSLSCQSQGIVFAHNIMNGKITDTSPSGRETAFFKRYSTEQISEIQCLGGDMQFYNNVFAGLGPRWLAEETEWKTAWPPWIGFGLHTFGRKEEVNTFAPEWHLAEGWLALIRSKRVSFPNIASGNVYYYEAVPYQTEKQMQVHKDWNPEINVEELDNGQVVLHLKHHESKGKKDYQNVLVKTQMLGKNEITQLPYTNYDDKPLTIDTDYFGKKRNPENPNAGPFVTDVDGPIVVWPQPAQ